MEEQTAALTENLAKVIDLKNLEQLVLMVQEKGVEFGFALISAVLIFLVGRFAVKLVLGVVRRLLTKAQVEKTLETFLCNILSVVLTAVVVIAAIGALGVETTSLMAVLGAAGLAVGLALQGSLSNFAAGVLIIAFKPYKTGDWIEGAGVSGTVKAVQIFTTVLHTGDNKKVIVPNGQMMNGTITNFSANDTRRVDLVFGIGYDDDIDKARAVIEAVVAADERILAEPEPKIAVQTLGDSSVNFIVRPWVNTPDYWAVNFSLTEQIKKQFDAADISIPYPQRDVHVYQHGNAEA